MSRLARGHVEARERACRGREESRAWSLEKLRRANDGGLSADSLTLLLRQSSQRCSPRRCMRGFCAGGSLGRKERGRSLEDALVEN
eukprot:4075839-Pleurochrysis_carterae.AAC.1